MPKVLFINASKNYGSTGKIVEQIGLLAQRKGWKACLVHAARYNRQSRLFCIKAGSVLTEKWHAQMSQLFDRHGLHSFFTTKMVISKIKKFAPDIIHLHNIHGYFLHYPQLFKYLIESDIPVVWTLHDCWSFTGHCSYFDLVDCNKWKTGCHQCPNLKNYPRSVWLDRSAKNYYLKKSLFTGVKSITMVPVSEWLGEMTRQSFMGKYPIRVIHNGVDTTTFRVKSNALRKKLGLVDKFVVLGVSNNGFSGRKGLDDFIELSKLLNNNYQIIMIGLKKEELDLLPKNIMGLKRTSNLEELVDYYNLADIFINPTYSDNFPTTNLESLACGTPVITYRTGGSPEAIDEKTGVVIEQGNVAALANAIMQLRRRPLSSEACRKRAEEYYDKDTCFEKYLDLYEELLKTK